MKERSKFNFKINVIANKLENYTSLVVIINYFLQGVTNLISVCTDFYVCKMILRARSC